MCVCHCVCMYLCDSLVVCVSVCVIRRSGDRVRVICDAGGCERKGKG